MLPRAVTVAASQLLTSVGLSDPLELEETLLYASVDPVAEAKLRTWLDVFVNRLPSWRVTVRERRPQPRTLHCRNCGHDSDKCPSCGQRYVSKPEKGIAVLLSSDADFVPAVERIQEKGLKVINAGWQGKGHELRAACWASFDLDGLIAAVSR